MRGSACISSDTFPENKSENAHTVTSKTFGKTAWDEITHECVHDI